MSWPRWKPTWTSTARAFAGILVEPLVQGAEAACCCTTRKCCGGCAAWPTARAAADFRRNLHRFRAHRHDVRVRAGGIRPDILTLSKALTGGLPLAATVASNRVFDAFWSDDPSHALMHGPTFMGNALACAAANASAGPVRDRAAAGAGPRPLRCAGGGLAPCRDLAWVRDVRVLGAIGVVELDGIADREALKRRLVEAGVGSGRSATWST